MSCTQALPPTKSGFSRTPLSLVSLPYNPSEADIECPVQFWALLKNRSDVANSMA